MTSAEGVSDLTRKLAAAGYLASEELALLCWLALSIGRPLLVEGPAGTGKTDLARALSEALSRELVRLQCYEGLDESKTLYEWDYAKQMLYTQLLRDAVAAVVAPAASLADAADRIAATEATFFSTRFLIARPVLRALTSETPVVLLVDEIDRADPQFEAFLLEVLAEGQATIPEVGTIRAKHPPLAVLTSNASRDVSDALRRRCLHAFLDYPPPSREQAILELHVPGLGKALTEQLTRFAERLRDMDLQQAPSIAEVIDWGRALLLLGATALDEELARSTLGALVKRADDRSKVEGSMRRLVEGSQTG
ncbi:MAG TPA: MoxR family ATPase [Polyangiaceae bacterium]|nr:MoxR family ATPase [Polyangiaceae bacterium]